MARLLNDSNDCQPSLRVAELAIDGIFVGSGLGPAIAKGLAKSGLEYVLPRMGTPACQLLATGLALIALSQ